mmetsp:Transcript_13189/g.20561  ORF Transcript_13189/g.20561 Transcript_13189/m.20561 type:complete len:271 (-) Transcript_13189:2396-3208(-)
MSSKKEHHSSKNQKWKKQKESKNHHRDQQQQQKISISRKKLIYLIRHGESLGQIANFHRMDRKRDPRLTDAGLTSKGQRQAKDIPSQLKKLEEEQPEKAPYTQENIDLVVSSPLTRAIHTALLGFQDRSATSNFIIHPHLREQGGLGANQLPENQSRPIQRVLKHLREDRSVMESRINEIQFDLVLKEEKNEHTKNNGRKSPSAKGQIRDFLLWLYQERTEQVIAVVCHYNVIRCMLGPMLSPQNALPIPCELSHDGQLEPIIRDGIKKC